jgi:hypothetical protein
MGFYAFGSDSGDQLCYESVLPDTASESARYDTTAVFSLATPEMARTVASEPRGYIRDCNSGFLAYR